MKENVALGRERRDLLLDAANDMRAAGFVSRRRNGLRRRFEASVRLSSVCRAFEWEIPKIETATLPLRRICSGLSGTIGLLRMDSFRRINNLKKPVVSGILIRDLLLDRFDAERCEVLVDAGNMNMGFALRYFCERFGLRGKYIMSRFFPEDMTSRLESEGFGVVRAPARAECGVEREFYSYLVEEVRRGGHGRTVQHCLWHAKYSAEVLEPLGIDVGRAVEGIPDYLVLSVGSGATLSLLTAARNEWRRKGLCLKGPRIVVVEHERSPLLSRLRPFTGRCSLPAIVREECSDFDELFFRRPTMGTVPHSVIGPHFDEVNPFLADERIEEIDEVYWISDKDWMVTSWWLMKQGLRIGNSSAGNLAVALDLAVRGFRVMAVVVEPFRSYYRGEGEVVEVKKAQNDERLVAAAG